MQIGGVLLAYLLAREIITQRGAVITALIFAVLPAHTNSITFATGSFDSAGVLFGMGAIYFYIIYQKQKQHKHLYASLALASLAFFTYEIMLVVPLLIILYDYCIAHVDKREQKRKIKYYAYYFGLAAIYFAFRVSVVGKTFTGSLFEPIDFVTRMFTMLKGFWLYIYLTIVGTPLSITHHVDISTTLLDARVFLSLLGLLALLAWSIYQYRKDRRIYLFIVFWFFLAMAPVSNVIQIAAFVAENYLYLATFAWALLLGLLIDKRMEDNHRSQLPLICLLLLVAAYGYLTIVRNFEWRNDDVLFRSAIAVDPLYTGGYNGIAFRYRLAGEYDKAEEFAQKALVLNPNYYVSHALLGEIDMEQERYVEAIEHFTKVIELNDGYVSAYLNRGVSYFRLKDFENAESDYLRALEIFTDYVIVHKNLGTLYLLTDRFDQAIPHFEQVLQSEQDPEVYFGLGLSQVNTGRVGVGRKNIEKALQLKPDYTSAQSALQQIDK